MNIPTTPPATISAATIATLAFPGELEKRFDSAGVTKIKQLHDEILNKLNSKDEQKALESLEQEHSLFALGQVIAYLQQHMNQDLNFKAKVEALAQDIANGLTKKPVAVDIVYDAFTNISSGAGELEKKLASAAKTKIEQLRRKILDKLNGNDEAEAIRRLIQERSPIALGQVAAYLQQQMNQDPNFKVEIKALAEDIAGKIEDFSSTVQNVYNKPENRQFSFSYLTTGRIISILASILALLYLIAIPFGVGKLEEQNRRLSVTEAGILAIVLLLGTELIGNIAEITLGSGGLKVKVENLGKNVEANKKANQRQSAVLALLATGTITDQAIKTQILDHLTDEEVRALVYDSLIPSGNGQLIIESLKKGKPIEKIEENTQTLRELRSLYLIKAKTSTQISSIENGSRINDYFDITKLGEACLALGSNETIKPSDAPKLSDIPVI